MDRRYTILLIAIMCAIFIVPAAYAQSEEVPASNESLLYVLGMTVLVIAGMVVFIKIVEMLVRKNQSNKAVNYDVEALINDLKDPKLAIDAACNLAAAKDITAVDPLIEALNNDKNSDVRAMAAYALGEIGSEKALVPLKKASKEDYDNVRRSAEQAIKKIQVRRALTNF